MRIFTRLQRIVLTGIILLSLQSHVLLGQEVEFKTSFHVINADNGLNSSEVYSVGQDSQGYMWFCSDAGVTRYDGYYFESFTVDNGLVDNVVFDFYEDSEGKIWFLSYNSLLCYYYQGKICEYPYNDLIRKVTLNNVASEKRLSIAKDGTIYFALRGAGIIKITPKGELSQIHHELNTIELNRTPGTSLISLDLSTDCPTDIQYPLRNLDKNEIGKYNPLRRMWYDPTVKFWGDQGCVMVQDKIINASDGRTLYEGSGLTKFGMLDRDKLWISGLDGLIVARVSGGSLEITGEFLKGQHVSGLYKDHEGGVWVSTLNNGVYHSDGFFVKYTDESLGLMNNDVLGIVRYGNEIWTTYYPGVQELRSGKRVYSKSHAGYSRGVSNSETLALSSIDNEDIAVGKDYIKFPFRTDFCADERYIYSVTARVYRYDTKNGVADTLYDGLKDVRGNRQNRFTAVAEYKGQLMLGSVNGLYKLVKKHELAEFPNLKDHLNLSISDIYCHPYWGIVAATTNNGVFIFKDGKTEVWNLANGLVSDNVSCISADPEGRLFIGTNKGLQVLDRNRELYLIAANQGVTRQEINCLYPSGDTVWIGTTKGLFVVDYGLFNRKVPEANSVELTTLYVDDRQVSPEKNQVQLPYNVNLLRLRFRTKSYRNWYSKRYQYRLSPEDEWISIESPEIIIARPKGDYTIQVRFMRADQKWSDTLTLLHIHVTSPIWQKWYFWSGLSFLISLIVIFLYRRRQKKVEQLLRMKNEMLSLEQQVQAARMNPHFIFNVLNSIYSCLTFNENELAARYLLKFSGLMRDLLKTAGGSTIQLKEEIEILTKYLEIEQLRQKETFDFSIDCANIDQELRIPSMIVQPFVENAVIHGVSNNKVHGIIEISFRQLNDKTICIEVKDNGENPDINVEKMLQSEEDHAIGITRQRLKNYSAQEKRVYTLSVERVNNPKPLTIISLTVPIIKS